MWIFLNFRDIFENIYLVYHKYVYLIITPVSFTITYMAKSQLTMSDQLAIPPKYPLGATGFRAPIIKLSNRVSD